MYFYILFHPHVFPQIFSNNNFQFLNICTKWTLEDLGFKYVWNQPFSAWNYAIFFQHIWSSSSLILSIYFLKKLNKIRGVSKEPQKLTWKPKAYKTKQPFVHIVKIRPGPPLVSLSYLPNPMLALGKVHASPFTLGLGFKFLKIK